MQRKTFDFLASVGGLLIVVVLLVAGGLLMWGYSFANSNVHDQLAEQQIVFPPAAAFAHPVAGTEITPSMIGTVSKYAGQPLVTGQQAEVYANDFIAVHLQEIGGGKTYAQLSAEAMALPKGSPAYTAAEAKVQTVFQGTTLRGLLLEAYAFGTFATIALIAGISAFVLAGLMAILVAFGFWHARRTDESTEIGDAHKRPSGICCHCLRPLSSPPHPLSCPTTARPAAVRVGRLVDTTARVDVSNQTDGYRRRVRTASSTTLTISSTSVIFTSSRVTDSQKCDHAHRRGRDRAAGGFAGRPLPVGTGAAEESEGEACLKLAALR